jgi:hypothetical protein
MTGFGTMCQRDTRGSIATLFVAPGGSVNVSWGLIMIGITGMGAIGGATMGPAVSMS